MYSLGLGLPFLAIGLLFDHMLPWLKKIGRYSAHIYIISGILLIAIGILVLTDNLSWFSF
jgi:cytochrome c-type biogenesis protein